MKPSIVGSVVAAFCLGFASLTSGLAQADDLEWSGLYRIEGVHIKNDRLDGNGREKNYGLQHLILRPKIVAADTLTIYSRFDIFNYDNALYPNSQLGQVFGSGIGDGSPTSADNSNALSDRQAAGDINITHLYLSWVQEFGALVAGRAPLHFGLGMTHNAGNGLFDHWYDTRDMVGYKIVLGNIYFLPMIAKVDEGLIGQSDDITDLMVQLQYENPETNLEMGVFYQMRKGNPESNDVPTTGPIFGDDPQGDPTDLDAQYLNVYALKETETIRFGMEASFNSGDLGVVTGNGDDVTISSFGVAGEFEWRPQLSKFQYGANFGVASGDDPATDDSYEGFVFDRNYDVAFLMFNHPMGQADFLRTGLYGGGPQNAATPDTEAISNTFYLAPYLNYQWTDKTSVRANFVAGWLSQDPIENQEVEKALGYEVDLGLNYSPREGVVWLNQVGLFFPGPAFEGGEQYKAEFAYGITTKAAISF